MLPIKEERTFFSRRHPLNKSVEKASSCQLELLQEEGAFSLK
jgi:hypothetical protein